MEEKRIPVKVAANADAANKSSDSSAAEGGWLFEASRQSCALHYLERLACSGVVTHS
jgi:hypothetical protein